MADDTERLRQRIIELEQLLTAERQRNSLLTEELRALRSASVSLQAQVEQEEELLVNKLMKRMAELQKEKAALAMQVEQEEEYLTNTLQKKLDALRREKIDLENKLEQEEEYLVNKLQKQLDQVAAEKRAVEKRLEEETAKLKVIHSAQAQEIAALKKKMEEYERERTNYTKWNSVLRDQLEHLKMDNFSLQQKIHREHEKLAAVSTEQGRLMSNIEIGDEREFNEALHKRAAGVPQLAVEPATGGGGEESPRRTGRPRARSYSTPGGLSMRKATTSAVLRLATPASSISPNATAVSPTNQQQVLKLGPLRKKDFQANMWTTKFFVLYDNNELWCWPDETEYLLGTPPEGILNLDTVVALTTTPSAENFHHWKVRAVTPQDIWELSADSQELWQEWAGLLKELMPNAELKEEDNARRPSISAPLPSLPIASSAVPSARTDPRTQTSSRRLAPPVSFM